MSRAYDFRTGKKLYNAADLIRLSQQKTEEIKKQLHKR
jgi:hypothetical protein